MLQQTGMGTSSSKATTSLTDVRDVLATADGATTFTGALGIFRSGAVVSGCVFVILTVGFGAGFGSGRMLMRAVSFFGPACVADPG